jgi:predicted negative regulator of RcsB-dependent stress response
MEIYENEEERLEAVQRWWKENKQSMFGGVLLGVAVVVGWNMWQGNKLATAEQASGLYQQLTQASEAKQAESAQKLAERIIQQYASTAYAEYARLFLAKFKAEAGDLPAAKKLLEEALAKSGDDNLKHIARLRLGRVMLAAGEVDPALKLIEPASGSQSGKFAGLYEELKGDLYAAAKRPNDARMAYEKAKEQGANSPLLELKLNDLPAVPGAAS